MPCATPTIKDVSDGTTAEQEQDRLGAGMPFNPVNAVILVVVTFVAGYSVGFVFAAIWNRRAK